MNDSSINLIINSEPFKKWLNDKPPRIRDNWKKYKMMTVEKYIKDMENETENENRNKNRNRNRNRKDITIQDENYTDINANNSNDNVIVNKIGPYKGLQFEPVGGKRKRKTLKRKRSKKTKNSKKSRKSKRKMTRRRR